MLIEKMLQVIDDLSVYKVFGDEEEKCMILEEVGELYQILKNELLFEDMYNEQLVVNHSFYDHIDIEGLEYLMLATIHDLNSEWVDSSYCGMCLLYELKNLRYLL